MTSEIVQFAELASELLGLVFGLLSIVVSESDAFTVAAVRELKEDLPRLRVLKPAHPVASSFAGRQGVLGSIPARRHTERSFVKLLRSDVVGIVPDVAV